MRADEARVRGGKPGFAVQVNLVRRRGIDAKRFLPWDILDEEGFNP